MSRVCFRTAAKDSQGTGTLKSTGCLKTVQQIPFYEFERDPEHQTSSFINVAGSAS